MDFGRAFSFQFQDPDWLKKIGLTGLILLIPIIGQLFLLGWGIEITRRVIRRETELLPDLDFGEHLGKGLQVFIIQLVYSIPVIIFSLPSSLSPLLMGDGSDETMVTVSMIISLCCAGLQILYSLFLAFVLPAAMGNFAAKGNLGAGFAFGEVFGLVRANLGAYFMVLLGTIVAGFIAPLGLIACIIGVIITAVYAGSITSHLTGQAYREAARL